MAGDSAPKIDTNEKLQPSDRVLTPPTSEDMNKQDDNSSDLSDLDDDNEADMEEITPDHYWDEANGGQIPVFKPVR